MDWKHEVQELVGDVWRSSSWTILGDTKQFIVDTDGEPKFPSFPEAEQWCIKQDRLAAAKEPEIPLPKPGDVWGVLGKPETWRNVWGINAKYVDFNPFNDVNKSVSPHDWQAWVRESGAINLVADHEALAARVKELESHLADSDIGDSVALRSREHLLEAKTSAETWKRECDKAHTERWDAIRERDKARAERWDAIREKNEMKAALDAARHSLAMADERAKERMASKDAVAIAARANGWDDNHERLSAFITRIAAERDKACAFTKEAIAQRDKYRARADELYGKNERMQNCLTRYSQERDAARASRERLMAGLLEIRECGGAWCGTKVNEILAAEEGAGK